MITLADYKILKKIGSGGMGDVYLAEHKVLENTVAIKSLHANLVKDEIFRKRFKSEAKIHSKLNHPNVVKLIDFQERKDGLFIIMEYVEGQQLDDYIKNVSGPIAEKELITLFLQIVDAISHAHSKGLVHRDIKPANVIISKGKIKVLDFGIAKELSSESGLTKTGVQVGTPMYMSPEQVNADPLDNLTDIYSLGVTLFYMAVGNAPYESSNAMKMGIQIVTEPFPDAKNFYPAVSQKIERIIKKATNKKKSLRYQSCEEFKKDLISSKEPIEVPKNKSSKESSSKSKKSKLNVEGLILFFLLASVILYFTVNSGNQPEPKPVTTKLENEKLNNENAKILKQNREDEAKRLVEEKKKIEAKRLADQKRETEANRLAENKRKLLANRKAEEKKKAELDELNKKTIRLAENKRKLLANRKAEEKKKAELDELNKKTIKEENYSFNKSGIKPQIFYKAAEKERINKDFQSAIETYTKAINANPNFIEAYYKRGVCHVKLGNYQAAYDDFTKNIDLNSNNANVYRDRAVLKRLMGNRDYCDDYKMACDLGNLRSCSDYDSCK